MVICQPFFRFNCYYSTKAVIAFIICFSGIYNVPKFFEIEAVSTIQTHYEDTGNISIATKLSDSFKEQLNYKEITILKNITSESPEEEFIPQDYTSLQNTTSEYMLGYKMAPTALMRNPCYYKIYLVGLNLIFNGLIPFVALITLNSLILKEYREKYKHLEEPSKHDVSVVTREGTTTSRHSRKQGAFWSNIYKQETRILFFIRGFIHTQ